VTGDGRASGRRNARLAEEIREEVAAIIARELKDPRIGFVTVTRVELAADLRWVRVYVGILGDAAQREKCLTGLKQATGFVRREMGRRIRVRYTPELSFVYDAGLDATDRVARLLEETAAAHPAKGDGSDGAD
jgi:ribosome-binding factor A